MLGRGEGFVLLDCRTAEEFKHVALSGAIHIPMDQLADRLEELDSQRSERIVVYCHMGVRSEMVSNWLRENGFPKSQSMAGGIDAWAMQIDTSLARY